MIKRKFIVPGKTQVGGQLSLLRAKSQLTASSYAMFLLFFATVLLHSNEMPLALAGVLAYLLVLVSPALYFLYRHVEKGKPPGEHSTKET